MKSLLVCIAMGLFLTSCSNDDNILPDVEPEQEKPQPAETKTAADYPVQNFMWQAMNLFYFWQSDVPNLADNKFSDLEDPDYISFLDSEDNPTDFFYKDLTYQHEQSVGNNAAIDRFSVVNENYKDLVNALQGISQSNGLEFNLYLNDDGFGVYGVVTYVMLNSDASTKDIKRGDVFVGVDGQNLNIDNYISLLFGDASSYILNMADIAGKDIVNNGKAISLDKIVDFSENPILVHKVIEQGDKRIGYLMYNGFLAAYDDELNDVFGDFSAQGIDELILDFRYNPGGRVSSAVQIASSIYKADTTAIFIQPSVNKNLQDTFFGQPDKFTNVTIDSETPLNELGLNRVYVLTSRSTASASELVINGLEPFVDVVQIGTTTTGKSEFSYTLVDDPQGAFLYDPQRIQFINPDNQWALQPLLGKNANADGFSGYENGLVPDFEIREDIENLGVLGDENERMLAFTLSVITGNTAKSSFQAVLSVDYLTNSKMFKPAGDNMFMDGLIKPSALTSIQK
ncbi:Peptidase family S41 [Pricia antarctica]|uniref:Peptidase family S41 n=2 Tax=Pricia antarctica TaxID=641691 RepID=A0A1G7ER02_9FLAO|nr:Peptidase family S41 [Pricia antarctica]